MLRPNSEALDKLLGFEHKVLDHGHVILVDYMGNESSIVDAARISYQGGTKLTNSDVHLLRYLMRHKHTSPYEVCKIKFRIKLPIFVARQFVRTRMSNLNEESARYSILANEFYIPEAENIQPQAKDNKQGRSGELTKDQAILVQDLLRKDAEKSYEHYLTLLDDPSGETRFKNDKITGDSFPGIARELARMNLSLNFYTNWIWCIDLHNLLHFLQLRMDSHAQYEIRVYANVIGDIVKTWMPNVWQAFSDYKLNAFTLSAAQIKFLQKLTENSERFKEVHTSYMETDGLNSMSSREYKELITLLNGKHLL